MRNCAICSIELKFLNTPNFGSGKLNDGTEVCTKCQTKVGKIDPSLAFKLKKYSLEEVKNLLQEKATDDNQKGLKLEEIKAAIQDLKLDNISSFLAEKR